MLIDSRADRERQAWAVLRLLVDDPRFDPDDLDWTLVRAVAERAGVIVRVADTIVRRGEELPPRLAESAAVACTHTQRVLEMVDRLGAACRRLGIAHAFLTIAGLTMDIDRLAVITQKAEHEYAGTPVGIMDMTIVAGAWQYSA